MKFNFFFFNRNKKKKNQLFNLDNSKITCYNCQELKNKRYIFNYHEDHKNYCLTCLKDVFFFQRYSFCQHCNKCLYNSNEQFENFDTFMVLTFDKNHNTLSLCEQCFEDEYFCHNIIDNDLIEKAYKDAIEE